MPDEEKPTPEQDKEEPKAEPAKEEPAPEPEAKAAPEEPVKPAVEEPGKEEDAFRPEAIAKRIEKLGEESDIDRLAREEEQKLLARKKQEKKGKKKGLEAAASKKLAKIGDKPVRRPSTAVASAVSPEGDALIDRASKLGKWMRDNSRTVGLLTFLIVAGLGGFMVWNHFQKKKEANASLMLTSAIQLQEARIGDPDKDDELAKRDPRPVVKTHEERRDKALAKYREVIGKYPGTAAAMLSRLGEASILLDKKDADGALAAYNDVKASPLGQADIDVKGRAIEGIGFVHELKALAAPAEKDKHLDEALKAFKELAGLEPFKQMAQYHQARVLESKGAKDEATKILKELNAALEAKPSEKQPYLELVVGDRLRALDPTAVKPKGQMSPGAMPGNLDPNDPDFQQKLQDMIKKRMQEKGGDPHGGHP
jgi:hypothetical protein